MLLQMLSHQPRMIFTIMANTPAWVWGLLAALMALGVGQCFARKVGLRRVLLTPIGMALFSAFGMVSAFGTAQQAASTLALWLATAIAITGLSLWLLRTPPAGARYDAANRSFHLPGSMVPLVLIIGIFLVKYGVGVALALQPTLAHDSPFALQIALTYGFFNGIFAARAGRLLRLTTAKNAAHHVFAM